MICFSALGTRSATVNNTNLLNIGFGAITNTFTPMNTATATNMNTDNDTTNVTTNNTNNNNTGGRSHTWAKLFYNLLLNLLRILGTSEAMFFWAFRESAKRISGSEVLDRTEVVSGMVRCAEIEQASDECMDHGICQHFAQEHSLYDGNMLLRAAEIFVVALQRNMSPVEVGTLWDLGVKGQCHTEFSCLDMRVASCFSSESDEGSF